MTEYHPASSFGDPKAQPPSPRHTPTSAFFPSPVFETPRHYQGSFAEPGGLTPRFAEEYSVFNSTPGNLRGTQSPFADFIPPTPASSSVGHKRLLSAGGLAVEIATHVNHFSPNPNIPLPPVDPSRRLPSSPADPSTLHKGFPTGSAAQASPALSRDRSFKKARTLTIIEQSEPSQVISPPPTARRGERKLAPKLDMQHHHTFTQQAFNDSPHHDMAALMGSSGNLLAYPMSAPATAPANFWDPSVNMGMDLDFNVAGPHHAFQPPTPSSHRQAGSFEWNADVQLFQDANRPPPSSNQETNVQLARGEKALAPKPPASDAAATRMNDSVVPAALSDPFGMMNPGDGVNPGLLFSRPQSSEFGTMAQSGSAGTAFTVPGNDQPGGPARKASGVRGPRNGKLPDRTLACSPIKSTVRPGLGRSYSENRGKRAVGRGSLASLAPVTRPAPQTNSGPGVLTGRAGGRPSGRLSPSKTMPRMSSLASIPETTYQSQPRASVRFTIDSRGRARAETTIVGQGCGPDRGMTGGSSSREVSTSRSWDSSDDDSSSDDEPIIIPSRRGSSNASFALPDPRKPIGSIFHSSRRSVSDRSLSNSANDAESEAETVVNERQRKGGDATSELRKVVEDRQKRSSQMGSARSQRFVSASAGNFSGGIISPTSLAGSSHGAGGLGVRCVCDKALADEGDGLMIQCESCEMWLHGKCINVTRHTMPNVYICAFCADTPNAAARRPRESGLGIGGMVSPLANKSFRSFR